MNKRGREWSFVLYPESAPSDWLNRIRDLKVNVVISPLHDKDKAEGGNSEELKKAHYHILLSFGGLKSYEQVKEITDSLGQPIPQYVSNKTGMIRYFIHIDNPDKYQYKKEDIVTIGNVDLDLYFKLSTDAELDIVDDILDYCEETNCNEFYEIVDYSRKNCREWFKYLNKNAWLVKEYLKSKHFALAEKKSINTKQSVEELIYEC